MGGWPAVRTMASWAGRRRTSSAVRRGRGVFLDGGGGAGGAEDEGGAV